MYIADMTYLPIAFLPILTNVKVSNTIVYTLTELYTIHCFVHCTLNFKNTFFFTEELLIILNSSGGLHLFGTFVSVTNVVCTVYSLLYSTV